MIVYPSFFFFKALASGTKWEWKFGHHEEERGCDWLALFVKMPILVLIERTCRDFLPNLIWGTKDVGRYADMIVKSSMLAVPMIWLLNSTWLQHQIDKLAGRTDRSNKVSKES